MKYQPYDIVEILNVKDGQDKYDIGNRYKVFKVTSDTVYLLGTFSRPRDSVMLYQRPIKELQAIQEAISTYLPIRTNREKIFEEHKDWPVYKEIPFDDVDEFYKYCLNKFALEKVVVYLNEKFNLNLYLP